MSEIPAYELEPYRRELDVRVLDRGRDGDLWWAVLDDTILYPEGGGQPADRGRLGDAEVIDVQRVGGEVRHLCAGEPPTGTARLELDWPRRYDHMQQHTAQHLLSAIALERFGWATRSFHLGERTSDIELDVAPLDACRVAELEEAVAAEVRAARPILSRRVQPEEIESLGVRSRGLPADHRGSVRLVEIAGVDLNTCGGTHLASSAEVEAVKVVRVEPLRGGCRLQWVAGSRVRDRLGEHEERNAALRGLLDAGDPELAVVLGQRLEQLAEARRRARRLETRLAELEAERLRAGLGEAACLAEAHFADAGGGFLQQVARTFASRCPRGLLLVTADAADGGALYAVAAGGELGVDLARLGSRVADALGGRGGGRPPVVQGRAGSLAGREAALRLLSEAIGEPAG